MGPANSLASVNDLRFLSQTVGVEGKASEGGSSLQGDGPTVQGDAPAVQGDAPTVQGDGPEVLETVGRLGNPKALRGSVPLPPDDDEAVPRIQVRLSGRPSKIDPWKPRLEKLRRHNPRAADIDIYRQAVKEGCDAGKSTVLAFLNMTRRHR